MEHIIYRTFSVLCENELNGEVIVVDDNSPDGTGEIADQLKKQHNQYNLKVLHRKDKRGLSSAVLDGFEIAEVDLRLRGPGDLHGTQQSGNRPCRCLGDEKGP